MNDAPCTKTASPMEEVVTRAQGISAGLWEGVRRAKRIRENLLGSAPEKPEVNAKAPPPVGVISALQESHQSSDAASNALSEELAQIEKCLGL